VIDLKFNYKNEVYLYKNDKIAAPKVPFRGFRGAKMIK